MNNEVVDYKPSIYITKLIFNDNTEIPINYNDIVLFVGPNNVGKSRVLKDIKNDLTEFNNKVVIKDIEYDEKNFSSDSVRKYFSNNFRSDEHGNYSINVSETHAYSFNESNFRDINNGSNKYF